MYYPENREQLREIILKARKTHTALVPISSGGPFFSAAVKNRNTEMVCFSKMNHVLAINRHDRYVRAESGVTFGELIPKVTEQGLRLNLPFLPYAEKSVVASTLEREGVLIPKYQFDYTDPLLNVETVFGTGDDFRTGSAAGPGPFEELKADMVTPWGPGTIDFLRFIIGAQGTMGFVTWGTLKAEVLPSMSRLFFVESEDLSKLNQLCNGLLRDRVVDDCIILNSVNFAGAFANDAGEEELLLSRVAPWVMICRICGFERYAERRVAIYEGYLKEACETFGLSAKFTIPGLEGLEGRIENMLLDCDRRETYWKLRRGGVREMRFLTPPSAMPGYVDSMQKSCNALPVNNVGITIQPQVQGRAYRVECDVFFDDKNAEEKENAERICSVAEKDLFAEGAYFDLPYTEKLAELVYSKDPESTEIQKRIKKIFDPDGILNPGKLCF